MRAALTLLASSLLAACGGGGGDAGAPVQGLGTLNLMLADAPACGYDKVFITVQKVRVHTSSTAGEADAGWREIVLATPKRVDLLTLTNGVLTELGQTQLPAGQYQQLHLVLAANAAAPYANAVLPTGQTTEQPLETPSALQSGLKLQAQISVQTGQTADWALDFDACKSIVAAGASGRYLLKPVIQLLPLAAPGSTGLRVAGYVEAALGNGKAQVSVQQNGKPVRATPTDPGGRFELYPVPAGTYELVVTAAGRANTVVTGVPVTATAATQLGSTSLRLSPPASAMANASGTVTVAGSPANTGATVRALQGITGGPSVEVGAVTVDAASGAYALSLPTAAPVRWAYSANATSFSFTSSASDAGKFKLEATAPGQTAKTADIVLTGGTVVTPFVWP